jgi:hypothetical protein
MGFRLFGCLESIKGGLVISNAPMAFQVIEHELTLTLKDPGFFEVYLLEK